MTSNADVILNKGTFTENKPSTEEKYKVLLKLLNAILKNINEQNIKNMEEFVGIDREDIIKDINYQYLLSIQEDLFSIYLNIFLNSLFLFINIF